LQVRDAVAQMRKIPWDAASPQASPSEDWAKKLDQLQYLFDASPAVVEKLRRHCHRSAAGSEPADAQAIAGKLAALRTLDAHGLFVPESPLLGGFGEDVDGKLVNTETLKFYECLLAMDRGGALTSLRRGRGRSVVMEIGCGWGVLAYMLKTLFPNSTMILVDFPALFLFSATYLASIFPDAKIAFVTEPGKPPADIWVDSDFVFAPPPLLDSLRPPRLDLAINVLSFQDMAPAQVRSYMMALGAFDCPLVYSFNRRLSSDEPGSDDLYGIIGENYWVNEIAMLDVPYTELIVPPIVDKGRKDKVMPHGAGTSMDAADDDASKAAVLLQPRHAVGWKKYHRP
jgi:putative sugar O-methyltransferase